MERIRPHRRPAAEVLGSSRHPLPQDFRKEQRAFFMGRVMHAAEGLVRSMKLLKAAASAIKRLLRRAWNNVVILEGPDEFTY